MTITTLPDPGSTISAAFGDTVIEGEVLCVDVPRKIIVLQRPSANRIDTCDVFILRTEYLKDIKKIKEGSPPVYPDLNIEKIAERIKINERVQQEKLKFYRPDVPLEVRRLAEHIEKTLNGVVWDPPNVVVMEHTIIGPPYKEDNVSCNSDSQQARSQTEYVQKVVSRFHNDKSLEGRNGT